MAMRYFKYNGPATNTRGEHGECVRGGHETAGGMISVFDSAFGDQEWITIDAGLKSGEWTEITKSQYDKL